MLSWYSNGFVDPAITVSEKIWLFKNPVSGFRW